MTALPNAESLKGNKDPKQTRGKNSSPSPAKEAISTPTDIDPLTGVSVRYAETKGRKWFVLRATYGREIKARNFINALGIPSFVATHFVAHREGRRIVRVETPLIQQFVFVYSKEEDVEKLVRHNPKIDYISYYYNHFEADWNGYNPPLTVPYKQMINFIKVASVDSPYTMSVKKEQVHIKENDLVRITEGDFKGVVGVAARVKGNLRVVVEIQGVGMIATAYIPKDFLEKINPKCLD